MTSPAVQSPVANPNTSTSSTDWLAIAKAAVWYHDCQQIPSELGTLLALLDTAVKPQCVLEIGAWRGGSAWAWSHLPTVNHVISVTHPEGPEMASDLRPGVRWDLVRADSQLQATADQIAALLPYGGAGMVFIDADHTAAAARRDWELYGPMVERGGLVAFHDINEVPQHPEVKVDGLWRELAASFPSLALVAAPGQLGGTGILLR